MKSIRSVICFCLFLFVFNQLLFADKTIENDSLYTSEYISRIYMAEPERALSLLDGAESKKTIPLRIIHTNKLPILLRNLHKIRAAHEKSNRPV
jgi:exonuclease I